MSIRQLPPPRWTIPGNSGTVAAGYHIYFYQPGTSTPKATYTDYTGLVANTNPVVLDSRGEANIWLDGTYKVLAYTDDKDTTGVLVWSQDNYGEGTSSTLQGNFNLVLNGSFEDDANGDDLPDDWTIVEYTGGAVARDSLEQIHGTYSLKFTSVGTGGGYADSTLFAVQGSRNVPVSFATLASIATVHNRVDIIWYTAAAAIISTTTLYDDTATNPTSWTAYSYTATPPATARFAKIRLFGCKDDDTQAGITWFDNVVAEATTAIAGYFPNVNANVTASDEELNHSVGVTSAIQTQLNAKQATITGAATSITSSNLTASRALVSDGSGKVGVSSVTSTELALLSGKTGSLWTSTNDGAGSGLDADVVKGRNIYVAYVTSAGSMAFGPSGWSASKSSTGVYLVTHNLNAVAYTFAAISGMNGGSAINGYATCTAVAGAANSVIVNTALVATGAATDANFMVFVAL